MKIILIRVPIINRDAIINNLVIIRIVYKKEISNNRYTIAFSSFEFN